LITFGALVESSSPPGISTPTSDEPQRPATPAGWYEYPAGTGQRYWDGTQWTQFFHPPAPQSRRGLGFGSVVVAVWAGFLLGWGTIWLGAQAASDDIYWPIKTVISDEQQQRLDDAVQQRLEDAVQNPP
jgi:Protein of unknown function (DUF2510)